MKTKRFLSLILCVLLVLSPLSAGALAADASDKPVYTDLPETDGYYPYVRYLEAQKIMGGFPDGSFGPGEGLTRAQAAKIAALAGGLSLIAGKRATFSDVPAEHWAYSYIETAAEAQLMKGYPGGAFMPEKPITRAEAAALFMRLSGGALCEEAPSIADLTAGSWAYGQAATAVEAGIMSLSSDGRFIPDAAVTRGEFAQSLSVLSALGPALRGAELIGELTVTAGEVKVTSQDESSHTLAKGEKTAVSAGMKVATGNRGRAEISYDDGSGIRIEPQTELAVVNSGGLRYRKADGTPAVAVDKLEIKMNGGQILGALANRNEGKEEDYVAPGDEEGLSWWLYPYSARERVRVVMPSGAAGIFGSFWSNLVTSGGSSGTQVLGGGAPPTTGGNETVVLTGHVEVTSGGQTVTLVGGQMTGVPPVNAGEGGRPPIVSTPTPPVPLSPGQVQALYGASDWILNRAQEIQTNAPTLPPPPPPPATPGQPQGPQQPQQQPGQPQQQNSVVSVIQQVLEQTGAGASSPSFVGSYGPSDSDSGPSYTAPAITGPDTVELTEGYAENVHETYALGGYPEPVLSITTNEMDATLNDNTLIIPAEFPAGTYTIVLEAANGVLPNAAKTITVTVSQPDPGPLITSGPGLILLPGAYTQGDYAAYTVTGSEPLTYGVVLGEGSPDIFEFNGTTLHINSGVLTTEGSPYTITLTATEADGDRAEMEVKVCLVTLQPAELSVAAEGSRTETLSVTGGSGGYAFELVDPPVWAYLEANMLIVEPPLEEFNALPASIPISVMITDEEGNSQTQILTVTVIPPVG